MARDDLDPRQARALALLTAGVPVGEVAAELGCPTSTLWRWRNEDEVFAAALREAQARTVEAAQERVGALVAVAIDTLEAVMVDPTAPAASRISAAREVLERTGFDGKQGAVQAGDVNEALEFLKWREKQGQPQTAEAMDILRGILSAHPEVVRDFVRDLEDGKLS